MEWIADEREKIKSMLYVLDKIEKQKNQKKINEWKRKYSAIKRMF